MKHLPLRRAAAVLVLGVLAAGCSTSISPRSGPLVPAQTTQFVPPVSIDLTTGSSNTAGLSATSTYWLTSATAVVTVTNVSQTAPVTTLSMVITPPPCLAQSARVSIISGSTTVERAVRSRGRSPVTVVLEVPTGQSAVVALSVLTPACQFGSDPRQLYIGLSSLRAD